MMKKAIWVVGMVLLGVGAAWGGVISEDPGELTASGLYWIPGSGDFDLFKRGLGAEVSYREWFRFPWGVGVNLGVSQWDVDNGSNAYKYKALSSYDGDVLLIPIGAALYFNVIDWDNWNLVFNAGLKYQITDSNVSVYNGEELVKARQDVDIGDAVLGTLGAEYDYMVSEDVYVLGGAGYQFNVLKADTDYNNTSARDTSFEGLYLSLGCKVLF